MELNFGPRGLLDIKDASVKFRNFAGAKSEYNRGGERNFHLIIPNQEMADALMEQKNDYGAGWNVKIKQSGEETYLSLPVKVNFDSYNPPTIFLDVNGKVTKLDEETVHILDRISINSVDLMISPYDGDGMYGPFRKAYLKSIWVYQDVDPYEERYAAYRESLEEAPF